MGDKTMLKRHSSSLEDMSLDTIVQTFAYLDLVSLVHLGMASKALLERTHKTKCFVVALVNDVLVSRRAELKKSVREDPKYVSMFAFVRMFAVDDGQQAFRRKCSEAALERLLHVAQKDEWRELRMFAELVASLCVRSSYLETLTVYLRGREVLDSDYESDSEDDGNNDVEENHVYPPGTGELILQNRSLNRILFEAIQQKNPACLKAVLDSTAEPGAQVVLKPEQLQEAALACAKIGFTVGFATILAALASMDSFLVERVLCSAVVESASEGHGSFCKNIANTLFARIDRDEKALLKEIEENPDEDYEHRQNALLQRKNHRDGTVKNALVFACKGLHKEVVSEIVSGPMATHISHDTFKLAFRHAAMNGNDDIVCMFFDNKFVTSEDLGELFAEAVKRGYAESIRALIATGDFELDYVQYQREQAYLREQDEVVDVLDRSIALMQEMNNE